MKIDAGRLRCLIAEALGASLRIRGYGQLPGSFAADALEAQERADALPRDSREWHRAMRDVHEICAAGLAQSAVNYPSVARDAAWHAAEAEEHAALAPATPRRRSAAR